MKEPARQRAGSDSSLGKESSSTMSSASKRTVRKQKAALHYPHLPVSIIENQPAGLNTQNEQINKSIYLARSYMAMRR